MRDTARLESEAFSATSQMAEMENPVKKLYLERFGMRVFDQHLFWVLDELADAVESKGVEEIERAEAFYSKLLKTLQKNSKEHQYNTTLFKLSQRPPLAIRRLFSMCFMLGVNPQGPELWLAMVGSCMPVPEGWVYDGVRKTFATAPGNECAYDELKAMVPDLPEQPLPFHPCASVLQGLAGLKQTGGDLIPELTAAEVRELPENALLYYDMRSLKPRLAFSAKLSLIRVPPFSVEFALSDVLYGAAARANEPVFLHSTPGIPCPLEEMQAVFSIQDMRKATPDRAALLAQQKGIKFTQEDPQHTLPLSSHERLRAKAKPQPELSYAFIRGLLPQPPERMDAYGYVIIPHKEYFAPQAKQQTILNESKPSAKTIGASIQLTATLAFMRANKAVQYSGFLDNEHKNILLRTFGVELERSSATPLQVTDRPEIETSAALSMKDLATPSKQNSSTDDIRLNATRLMQTLTASERKNDEIAIVNIDGLDFPQPKLTSDQLCLGMQLGAGCYEVSISQLEESSRQFLQDCVARCKLFAQRAILGHARMSKKWGLRMQQWELLKVSIEEIIRELQQICKEIKETVEFIDFEEVFK